MQLMYYGKDHFITNENKLIHKDDVIVALKSINLTTSKKEPKIIHSENYNGCKIYACADKHEDYSFFVKDDSFEIQYQMDAIFKEMIEKYNKNHKKFTNLKIAGAAVAFFLGGYQAAKVAPDIVEGFKNYYHEVQLQQEEYEKQKEIAPIVNYLTLERDEMIRNGKSLENSIFNLNDNAINEKSLETMEYIKAQFNNEQIDQMFEGGHLTDYGKEVVSIYLKNNIRTIDPKPLYAIDEPSVSVTATEDYTATVTTRHM